MCSLSKTPYLFNKLTKLITALSTFGVEEISFSGFTFELFFIKFGSCYANSKLLGKESNILLFIISP